ncbi:MAG: GNAT family N-acetyltransferase [Erythrobacter sp.]|uniref:GNAT family N-acetyltransferase n=1 Tax=Erythrobacter sp. TaxID=1042 RepID=UPI00261987DE|nr:GNAT family N-acetyltransferase [Erythrobacter sp.]MDJ0979204.1 GNAT family N-acetyltransferase [Erythrobacter sp.]
MSTPDASSTNGTAIVVRPASAGDAGRLSLISNATFLETFAGQIAGEALMAHCATKHTPDFLAGLLANGAKAWLAELDDAPVGYALLTPPELDAAQQGDIELKKIYVLSRFHGGGLARDLLSAALAGAAGHRRLLLGVKADNARAIAFYEKHGFERIGTRRFDVGGKLYDDFVFARDLTLEPTI